MTASPARRDVAYRMELQSDDEELKIARQIDAMRCHAAARRQQQQQQQQSC